MAVNPKFMEIFSIVFHQKYFKLFFPSPKLFFEIKQHSSKMFYNPQFSTLYEKVLIFLKEEIKLLI